MTLLVTGGVGFVGSHFVRAAADTGQNVVVLDDFSGGTPAVLPANVHVVQGDIADHDVVTKLVREHRVRAVVHFAGKIQVGESVTNPSLYFDVNVTRSLAFLETLRRAEVENVVFSSTAAVYGNPVEVPIPESAPTQPVNPYGATKLTFEQALTAFGHAYGLRWAALRYFNASGAHPDGTLRENHEPETHLIPLTIDAGLGRRPALALFGEDHATPDGTCIRDYIHVCDLAEAHLRALERLAAGDTLGPLNLGTGTGYSVREVIDTAAHVLGKAVPYAAGPRRAGDPARLVADARRAREALSWAPVRSDLATILADTLRSRFALT